MKKHLATLLALVLTLAAVGALAATVEDVQPIRITGDLYITDYGFAITKYGSYTRYGCYLDYSEEQDAEGWTPCGYFTISNRSPYGQTIDNIYIRGGSRYNWYWNWKSEYIAANDSKTYFMSGYDSIRGPKGNWSVDCRVNGKNYVSRFTLSR